ncbi:MAG TPA: HEAT repeat domain-containing protein [Gemmatimonadales bacterium]|nr:HEAT repeat domain-containing protein [Gemmatimonadales bacterium]
MKTGASYVVRHAWVTVLVVASAAHAQSLEKRVAAAPDGSVRFSFAARPGVYGDGVNSINWGHNNRRYRNHQIDENWESENDWSSPCDSGPVRVALTKSGGHVTNLRVYVGGDWRPNTTATDLGTVGTKEASTYLLALAASDEGSASEKAILPAALADSVTVWPDLLKIAKNDKISRKVRRSAVFWLGQAAEDAATKGLTDLVEDGDQDREVRESAVFALSQRPKDEGVPALIQIAKANKDPDLRRKAIFWLGQSDDPRALSLFEELLTKP